MQTRCNKCQGKAKLSKALQNKVTYYKDFAEDDQSTAHKTGQVDSTSARLIHCYKCEDCGHSWRQEQWEEEVNFHSKEEWDELMKNLKFKGK